jgi:hypothetical protein
LVQKKKRRRDFSETAGLASFLSLAPNWNGMEWRCGTGAEVCGGGKIRNLVGREIGDDGQEMKSPPFLGLRKGEPSAIRRPGQTEKEKGEADGKFPRGMTKGAAHLALKTRRRTRSNQRICGVRARTRDDAKRSLKGDRKAKR